MSHYFSTHIYQPVQLISDTTCCVSLIHHTHINTYRKWTYATASIPWRIMEAVFSLSLSVFLYKLQVLSFQCGMVFTQCEACSHKTPVISAQQDRKSEVHITIYLLTQMLL